MRPLLFALALAVVSCQRSAPPLDPAAAKAAFAAQLGECVVAVLNRDHDKLADLTHPKLIELAGGRAKYAAFVEKTIDETAAQGFRLRDARVTGEPVLSADGRFGYGPTVVEMDGPNGLRAKQPSFMVGATTDGGRTWKFVDGGAVADEPAKLKQIFPDLPADLVLPKKQLPTAENP